ncbi:MAG: toll/interleukin-1 receptor domain-containing protein [Kiritimatiellales bacterium]
MKVFISHASEDKDTIARPLAYALKKLGHDVWFDEFSLKLGDSLHRSIEKGLADCQYGVVVLSPSFFAKEWPRKELDGLTTKEVLGGNKIILPVWHDIDVHQIAVHSPSLADKLGVSTKSGLASVVASIKDVLGSGEDGEEVDFKDFRPWANDKWVKTQETLFPSTIPASSSWTDLDDIIRVLNTFSIPNVNHMFLPLGGGMDMMGAARALEVGCIEIKIDNKYVWVLRPKELQFESFSPHFDMTYLRLETFELAQSGVYEDLTLPFEELAEIGPLNYEPHYLFDQGGTYDECGSLVPLPDDTRHVMRFFNGTFLVANKGSAFNHLQGALDAYSGQYSAISRSELRKFMGKLVSVTKK